MRYFFFVAAMFVALASSTVSSQAQKARVGIGYFNRANQRFAKGTLMVLLPTLVL